MKHPVYTLICERCRKSFPTQFRRQRTCGYKCRDDGRRKIHPDRLRRLAAKGLPRQDIAAALGVRGDNVRLALQRYGLYEMWSKRRAAA